MTTQSKTDSKTDSKTEAEAAKEAEKATKVAEEQREERAKEAAEKTADDLRKRQEAQPVGEESDGVHPGAAGAAYETRDWAESPEGKAYIEAAKKADKDAEKSQKSS